jgi:hypothetical protein
MRFALAPESFAHKESLMHFELLVIYRSYPPFSFLLWWLYFGNSKILSQAVSLLPIIRTARFGRRWLHTCRLV